MNINETKETKIKVKKSITLNTTDMLYQAIVTVYDKPKYYVYTLANQQSYGNSYYAIPVVHVSLFSNKRDADMYHDAVESVMEYQKSQPGAEFWKDINKSEIIKFYNSILPSKIGIKTLEKQK